MMWAVLLFIVAAGATSPKKDSFDSKPVRKCPVNEIWVKYPIDCPSEYCSKHFNKIKCPIPKCSEPGCRCKEGYLREDETKKCIPANQCPQTCPENEYWEKCPIDCPSEFCSKYFNKIKCPTPKCSEPGCRCKEGYLREDETKKCIPANQCPKTCPENEYWEKCPIDCPSEFYSKHFNKIKCPTPKCSEPGCRCKEGYLREDETKKCIPANQCPKACPENEYWEKCPIDCPSEYCSKHFLEFKCPSPKCSEPGCRCKKGYLREDKTKKCIPRNQCPQTCPENEYWEKCPIDCPSEFCSKHFNKIKCPAPECSDPSCRCKKGYLRVDKTNKCVPEDKCFQQCGYNEELKKCRTICPPQNCDISYTSYFCTEESKKCEQGCDCIKHHLRNASGICIPNDQCDIPGAIKCGVNEELVPCKRTCPPEVCEALYLHYLCAAPDPGDCEPGCMCKQGHLRNKNGTCIPQDDCPPPPWVIGDPPELKPQPLCPENETYVNCPSKSEGSDCAANVPECNSGCQCQEGYTRNEAGNCELQKSDPQCGVNEELVPCVRYCPPQNCLALYVDYPCARPDESLCQSGCMCQQGFVRDENNTCMPQENCPPPPGTNPTILYVIDVKPEACPENETYVSCSSKCPKGYSCADKVLDPDCEPGCKCKEGYIRNVDGGNCELVKKQPPVCPPNEYYETCVPYCPPGRMCAAVLEPDCEPGCKCKNGYIRNQDGDCRVPRVPPKPRDCPPNEFYETCVPYCPPRRLCPAVMKPNCEPGCKCKEGYERNSDGDCSLPPAPPKPPTCPENEFYYDCIPYCPPDRLCAAYVPDCTPGCLCKQGYERNQDGYCVKAAPPPPIYNCGVNETSAKCRKICPGQDCSSQYGIAECNIPIPCEPGCDCKDGYLRNKEKRCVLKKECPPPPWASSTTSPPTAKPPVQNITCSANEIYVQCQFNCPTIFCPTNEYSHLIACSPPYPCPPGCVCSGENVRRRSRENRTCIPIQECPPVNCSQPHEVWNICTTSCLAEYCEDVGKAESVCLEKRKYCIPKCVCEKGYYRNSTGTCVAASECPKPKCEGNQTEVACPSFKCPNQFCPTGDKTEYACKPPRDCPSGCGCGYPYVYKSLEDLSCILPEDCPKPKPKCEGNQTVVACPSFKCPNQFCPTGDETEYACKPPRDCPSGCGCDYPYVYKSSEDLTCILPEDCPKPKPKCEGNQTVVACPSFKCPNQFCPTGDETEYACKPPRDCPSGCGCGDPYVYRSPEDLTCILPEDCPKPKLKCEGNQTEVACPSFKCPNQFCPTGNETKYACKPPHDCPSGCGCGYPYVYKSPEDLTCILPEDCPKPKPKCEGNQTEVACPSFKCPNQFCPTGNETEYACKPPPDCPSGCGCGYPYVYKSPEDLTCILPEDCPKPKPKCEGNQTEVYCPSFRCPHQFCPVGDKEIQIFCKPPRDCPTGCGCAIPYRYRSKKDLSCVLAEDCPPQKCTRPNEEWSTCPQCLAESCADAYKPQTGVCNELIHNCQPRCVCKKGFYRNESKICVRKEECFKCKENERYVACKAQCPTDYCPTDDKQDLIACDPPEECTGGCICKLNYKLKSFKQPICIPVEKCPKVNCTRPHEIWATCPSPCLLESCENAHHPAKTCNYLVHYCNPRCICEKNHYRNDRRICVHKRDCPPPRPKSSDIKHN